MKRSKKYTELMKKVDVSKQYKVEDAVKIIKENSYTKFVSSLDISILLNVPTKYQKETIRGSVVLPHQSGKSKTVVVIAEPSDHKVAKEAGADEVGGDEMIKKIEGGYTAFDVLIATPEVMIKLSKLGKLLGPKGLMPNPRNNTVTKDLEKVIKSYKSGKMDYKLDEQFSVKTSVGKLSLDEKQLTENVTKFFDTVFSDTKKFGPNRLKKVVLSSTMGPGLVLDNNQFLKD